MVLVFKNVGEKSLAKIYHFLGLLFVVSNIYVKLVNKRLVNYLEKCGLFSDFQYVSGLFEQLCSSSESGL